MQNFSMELNIENLQVWQDITEIASLYGNQINANTIDCFYEMINQDLSYKENFSHQYLNLSEQYLESFILMDYAKLTNDQEKISKLNKIDKLLYTTQKTMMAYNFPNAERWETSIPLWANENTLNFAIKAGFSDEVLPKNDCYDYAVILGGTQGTMNKRAEFLAKLLKQNSDSEEIFPKIFINNKIYGAATKSRLFAMNIDGDESYLTNLSVKYEEKPEFISEHEMMEESLNKYFTDFATFTKVLNAKPKINQKRATTFENAESVLSAVNENIEAINLKTDNIQIDKNQISILVVSNAPYIQEQKESFQAACSLHINKFPFDFELEFVGPKYQFSQNLNKDSYVLWSSFASYLYKGYDRVVKEVLDIKLNDEYYQSFINHHIGILSSSKIRENENTCITKI